MKPEYVVYAVYVASRYWADHDVNGARLDRQLEKVVGKGTSGGGLGFGERDLDWSFKKEEDAKKAVKRIRSFAKRKHIRIRSYMTRYEV